MDGAKLFGYKLMEWLNEELDADNGTRDHLEAGEIVLKNGKLSYRFKVGGWIMQGEYDSNESARKEKDRQRKRAERKEQKRN